MSGLTERMRGKLASSRGASMLFALLLLLIAAIVSCVMLSAAVTSLKVVNNDRAHTQAQLSLDSAARLATEQLDGLEVRVTGSQDDPAFRLLGGEEPAGLRKLVFDAFQQVYQNPAGAYTVDRPYVSKELSFAPSDDRLQMATGVLRVYPAAEGDLGSAGRAAFSMELTLTLQQEQGAYSETLLVSPSSVSKGSGTTYAWACTIEG